MKVSRSSRGNAKVVCSCAHLQIHVLDQFLSSYVLSCAGLLRNSCREASITLPQGAIGPDLCHCALMASAHELRRHDHSLPKVRLRNGCSSLADRLSFW